MPRKASQAAKKETASAESKTEGGTTRRSGRTVTKQEPASSSKEPLRSRRSSTAAQTAASVADSKTPKGKSSGSRRDSASPSEGRQKGRRGSVETPAVRVKSARRATGKVNYKESDGEEEVAAPPKYEETAFESNEEFEDSESGSEKTKAKGRGRAAKTPAKGKAAKTPPKSSRSARRGRPIKKQSSDEEDEPEEINLSEDSVEAVESKKSKPTPAKETARSGRGRKSKADETETKPAEDKPKSRRSARASSVKEEPPKKRPSRGVQKKKYTEDDDDEIEEIDDTKEEKETKPQEDSGRKRKRGSTTESNKRLKEDESTESQEKDDDDDKAEEEDEGDEKDSEMKKEEVKEETEKEDENESVEEPMEVDASEDVEKEESQETAAIETKKVPEKEPESVEEEITEVEESEKSDVSPTKEKLNLSKKQESVDSSEHLDESMQSFDSDQGSRAEQSVSSGLEDSQDAKETKSVEKSTSQQEKSPEKTKSQINYQQESSNSFEELDDSSESKDVGETIINNESKEAVVEKVEINQESKTENSTDSFQNDFGEKKAVDIEKPSVPPSASPLPAAITHSRDANSEASFNGSENPVSNTAHVIHSTSAVNLHPEDSAPKANGAHDLHNNSVSESDQYYVFPGRKYVINTKLGDNIRQTVKDKSFGFVSCNLGLTASDSSIQKEKLLNELNKLDAHIICMQQVSKSFYNSVLDPSLDALGFKGTFSQPEESEKNFPPASEKKGIATFYKSSLFRLSGQSEASLKHLIEKELETASMDPNERLVVKTHVKGCGHVLFTHLATVIGMHSLTVANVQVPPTDLSIHALQVSCLAREVVKINGGTSRPFLLAGEFNMVESEAPYQLLRDGYLSNEMIEELQGRKDISLPGKENAALVNLLWKSFQHPSSTLCSCYRSVLDHEVSIPEQKVTSPDLLWYSSDSLYTIGVLDVSETAPSDRHFSLKADIAFSM